MSSDISHRIPLKRRLQRLRICDVSRDICIFPIYLKSVTPICLFTMQFTGYIIVVKFEEINLKFGKVRKSSRYSKVRKSSRSACNHDCYRKSILNIVTVLNFMQYNALQQGSDYSFIHFNKQQRAKRPLICC